MVKISSRGVKAVDSQLGDLGYIKVKLI